MASRKRLQEGLHELNELRSDPGSPQAIEKLTQVLTGNSNHLAAAAARIVGEFQLEMLEDLLVQAFDRFMDDPLQTDKSCAAKTAIVEALFQMDSHHEDLFLRGLRHVQLEPVYGGKEDTAVRLRYVSALGLVRTGYPDVMIELAQLLADKALDARIGAVRAIAYARQEAGIPLLRFKALSGDEDARVIYETFKALLDLSPQDSLPFVASFFAYEDPAIAESAVLTLGESRLDGALELLREGWECSLDQDLRRFILLAIAMLRYDEAIDFLLSLLKDASPGIAQDAIAALEMYQNDEKIWGKVQKIVEVRDDIDLSAVTRSQS
jgi:HEAT repeat protein